MKHIFQKSVLTKDQTMRVLEAIHLVYPIYEAKVCIEKHPVDISPLVQPLYEKNGIQNDYDIKCTSSDTEKFLEDAMKLFEDQLEQERVGYSVIQSVERKNEEILSDKSLPKTFSEIQSQWKERLASAIEKEIELVKTDNIGTEHVC